MSSRPPPFLDKICSSQHLPVRPGSTGFFSTRVLPDLTHTAIATKFCSPVIPSSTPKDYMTKVFRHAALLESLQFERPRAEARYKRSFFKRAHVVFYNHVLCELEAQHREKAARRERIWQKEKRQLGFSDDSFSGGGGGRGSEAIDSEAGFEVLPMEYGGDAFEADGLVVDPAAMPVLREEGDEEEYGASALRYEGGMQISPPSPTSVNLSGRSLERANPNRAAPSSLQRSKSASLLLESISQTLSRASTAKSSPASNLRPKPATVTKQRPRKAFNRMTFFECLLDTMHVPEPKVPRYGQLPSPIRVTRVTPTGSNFPGSPTNMLARLSTTPPPPSRLTTTRDSSSNSLRARTSQSGSSPRLPNLGSCSSGMSNSAAFSFDDFPLEEPIFPMGEEEGKVMVENAGLEKWAVTSVRRCLTGDKPRKIKHYH